MDSETALKIVNSVRNLVESGQGSREELELDLQRLCSIVEDAVVAIDVYQQHYNEDSIMLMQDLQLIAEATFKIQELKAQLAELTKAAKPSSPPPTSPNHSSDSLPSRDSKGRFIKYGADTSNTSAPKQQQPVVTSSKKVNPCTGCKTCNKFCK